MKYLLAVIVTLIFGMQPLPAQEIERIGIPGLEKILASPDDQLHVVNFWATWCPPCVASIPEIKAIHDEFKSNPDFVLVGVSEDDNRRDLESFVQKRGLTWPQIFDLANRKEMARAFGVSAIPTVILIDRQGNYRRVDLESNLAAEIERLLKSPA